MPKSRAILAVLLIAAPLLCAQTSQTAQPRPAAAQSKAVPAPGGDTARQPARESFQITIDFKRTFHGKLVSDKTYTLGATTNETLPAIRDDTRYRANTTDKKEYLESNTDVDILALRRSGKSIYLALKISVDTIGSEVPEGLPKLPALGTHKYILTPTVPIGKRITVYSSNDALNNTAVEVELLIQPFDPNQPNAPEAQHQATSTNEIER